MKRKPTWWKLYVFGAVTCAALFLFPPTNQVILILWMVVMYGGIVVWMNANKSELAEHVYEHQTIVVPPVAEFFDEDRVYLQRLGTEITDDNLRDNPHQAA